MRTTSKSITVTINSRHRYRRRARARAVPLIVCGCRRQAKTAFIPSFHVHLRRAREAHEAPHLAAENVGYF